MRKIHVNTRRPVLVRRMYVFAATVGLLLQSGLRAWTIEWSIIMVAVLSLGATACCIYATYNVPGTSGRCAQHFDRSMYMASSILCGFAFAHVVPLRPIQFQIDSFLVGLVGGAVLTWLLARSLVPLADRVFDRHRSFITDADCHSCGYDLTGNVSGRCPECGALRDLDPGKEL